MAPAWRVQRRCRRRGRKQRQDNAAGLAVALELLVPAHAGFQIDFVPPDFEARGGRAPMNFFGGGAVRGAVTKKAIVVFLRHDRESPAAS
jgi:hypothetical protein